MPPKLSPGDVRSGQKLGFLGQLLLCKRKSFLGTSGDPQGTLSGGLDNPNTPHSIYPAIFNPFSALFKLFGAADASYGPI